MKSIILSLAIIAVIVLSCCFYSCNKNEDAITKAETSGINNDLKLLTEQLETYNNDFFIENQSLLAETRGHNLAWWVSCAVADWGGAKSGMVWGGALWWP